MSRKTGYGMALDKLAEIMGDDLEKKMYMNGYTIYYRINGRFITEGLPTCVYLDKYGEMRYSGIFSNWYCNINSDNYREKWWYKYWYKRKLPQWITQGYMVYFCKKVYLRIYGV